MIVVSKERKAKINVNKPHRAMRLSKLIESQIVKPFDESRVSFSADLPVNEHAFENRMQSLGRQVAMYDRMAYEFNKPDTKPDPALDPKPDPNPDPKLNSD